MSPTYLQMINVIQKEFEINKKILRKYFFSQKKIGKKIE